MLVLTRRPGEAIRIAPSKSLDPKTTVAELFAAGPIEVFVGNIEGRQVKIGIQADRRLVILRDELVDEE